MKLGAAILPLAISTGRVLLGLRSPTCDGPYTWAAFGGLKDPEDRTLADTALRELVEETGYTGPLILIPGVNVSAPGVRAHTFVGVVPHEFEPAINDEHVMAVWVDPNSLDESKLFWATRQFFANPVSCALLSEARSGRFKITARPSGRR